MSEKSSNFAVEMSRVSVIMPLYNKAPYVEKALRSVVNQSYKDWEVVVVDDGSTDGSADVVQPFLGDKCHLLSQRNAGVAVARNRGVEATEGELLAFLDADDWWKPTFLEEMVRFADAYPEASLWASNYWYFKPGKTRVAVDLPTGYFSYPKAYVNNAAMPVWTGAVLMRRDAFERVVGFPASIRLGEDFLVWSAVALHDKMAFLNKPLAYYNNALPADARATCHLYPPEQHMVFHLQHLAESEQTDPDWKALCDKLRINLLPQYWLSNKYHAHAVRELKKVRTGRGRFMQNVMLELVSKLYLRVKS